MIKNKNKRYRKIKVLEAGIVLHAFYWSVVLALPGNTFDSSIGYSTLCKVAPELVWSIIIALVGVTQLFALSSKGIIVRRAGHLLATGMWATIATMFFMANPFSTGGIYFITALWCAYLYWREGVEK